MATWEEMINGGNPVDIVNQRHKALMEKRQAENIARMRAANPGYLPGGAMPGSQQGFQRFAPPSVMDNKDEWLESQFAMADEHLGGPGDPAAAAQAAQAAATGGMSQGGGEGEISGGRTFGGMSMGDMPNALSSAINNAQGLTPAQAAGLSFMFPNFAPLIAPAIMSPELESSLNELSGMIRGGTIPDLGSLSESHISPDILGLPGVGLGGSGGIGSDGTAPGDDSSGGFGGFGDDTSEADNPGSTGDGGGSGSGDAEGAGANDGPDSGGSF